VTVFPGFYLLFSVALLFCWESRISLSHLRPVSLQSVFPLQNIKKTLTARYQPDSVERGSVALFLHKTDSGQVHRQAVRAEPLQETGIFKLFLLNV
jgi:hypothetical protein